MLLRVIPLPVHGALELAVGLAVAAAPFALGFGAAGILAATGFFAAAGAVQVALIAATRYSAPT